MVILVISCSTATYTNYLDCHAEINAEPFWILGAAPARPNEYVHRSNRGLSIDFALEIVIWSHFKLILSLDTAIFITFSLILPDFVNFVK